MAPPFCPEEEAMDSSSFSISVALASLDRIASVDTDSCDSRVEFLLLLLVLSWDCSFWGDEVLRRGAVDILVASHFWRAIITSNNAALE